MRMTKIRAITTIIFLNIFLSACMTSLLWGEYPVVDKKTTFQLVKEDQIRSFAKVIQNNQNPQFVVIGTDNAYLIDGATQNINRLLELNSSSQTLEILADYDNNLTLELDQKQQNNYEFSSQLQFRLIIKNPSEEQKNTLKAEAKTLNAKVNESTDELRITANIPIKGKIIVLDDRLKALEQQQMSKQYKIKLGYTSNTKSFDGGQFLSNLIYTPFALVADAIVIPLASVGVAGAVLTGK